MTLATYAWEWLEQHDGKPHTKATYRSIIRHQLGDLADTRLTRIFPPDIRRLLRERKGEGYSGRTLRAILDVLRMTFRMAVHDGLLERNPAESVPAPKIDAKEPVHFTADEARRFLEVAKDDPLAALFAVALGTGLRRGELLALTWMDVDVRASTVSVRRGKTAASARVVPLPAFALAALTGFERGPGPIWQASPSHVTRRVAAICEQAGLPRLTTHGLRHTYATLMREAGVSLETRRDLLGHSRTEMTMFYSHGQLEQQRRAVAQLEELVG